VKVKRYSDLNFGQDLFFIIGVVSAGAKKLRLDEERLGQFRKYCEKRFTKNGVIVSSGVTKR